MIKTDSVPFYLKLSQIMIAIVAFTYVMYIGQAIILPLVFALLTAILLNPFVGFLQRKGWNRVLAILVVILIAFILLAVLSYFVFTQARMFADALPQLKIKFSSMFEASINWISTTFNISIPQIHDWIAEQKGEGLSNSTEIIGKTIITVSGVLFSFFLIPVYVFMFLFYKKLLLRFIENLFPRGKDGMVTEVLTETKNLIQNYLYGLTIEAGIVAIMNSAALLIIGVDYAILIGVIGALLNVIPYIGGIIAISIPMIIAVATISPTAALWVFIAYIVIQFIDNQIVVPYVVASKVRINGLISIVVVIIGGAIWGIAGMFLSIPLTAIAKVFFDRIKPLKPWGILLGDEEEKKRKKKSFLRKKKATKK